MVNEKKSWSWHGRVERSMNGPQPQSLLFSLDSDRCPWFGRHPSSSVLLSLNLFTFLFFFYSLFILFFAFLIIYKYIGMQLLVMCAVTHTRTPPYPLITFPIMMIFQSLILPYSRKNTCWK